MPRQLTQEILNELSAQYGKAFYLLDSDVFEENYLELTQVFKSFYPKFNIAYSYKTNYTPRLVRIVDELGGYAEVVSDMEIEIALKAGVKPEKIIWNGPIKNKEKVEELLLCGGTVNIDSLFEIENIKRIAAANPIHQINIGIRCNYDVGDGVISRFGFDVDGRDFEECLRFIASTDNIVLKNLQVHFAKRNPRTWSARTEKMLTLYDKVLKDFNLKPERLDIGGGIYGKMPESLRSQLGTGDVSYNDYACRAATLFENHFKGSEDAPWLFIEPGSAIAGNCMRFVSRVETIKTIRNKTFVTVMGSQKNIGMNGLNPPMEIVRGGGKQSYYEAADIVGYTCIEGDILQRDYKGLLAIGDYIVISNCGSYSSVMKPPFILPNFPIIDISGEMPVVIKQGETFDDLFRTYSFE